MQTRFAPRFGSVYHIQDELLLVDKEALKKAAYKTDAEKGLGKDPLAAIQDVATVNRKPYFLTHEHFLRFVQKWYEEQSRIQEDSGDLHAATNTVTCGAKLIQALLEGRHTKNIEKQIKLSYKERGLSDKAREKALAAVVFEARAQGKVELLG